MAKILGELSVMINEIIRNNWQHYSDFELASKINDARGLKGKKKLSVPAVRKRRDLMQLKRPGHFEPKSRRPMFKMNAEVLKAARNYDPMRDEDEALIKRHFAEAKDGKYQDAEALIAAIMEAMGGRYQTQRGVRQLITDLGLKMPNLRQASQAEAEKKPANLNMKRWLATGVGHLLSGESPPQNMAELLLRLREGYRTLADTTPIANAQEEEIAPLSVYAAIDALYWAGRREMVVSAIASSLSPEKFHEVLSKLPNGAPPLWLVADKLEEVGGRSHAPRGSADFSLRGINRVALEEGTEPIPLPTAYSKPFHALAGNTAKRVSVAVISSPQVGLPYTVDIERNLTRCAFAAARNHRCDAIVVGGGLFRMMVQKTMGPNRLLYDLIAGGQEIDPESVAEHYRQQAIAVMKPGSLEPLFVTAAERFNELLRGWHKVLVRPSNQGPEFGGPVYIILGDDDLALARRLAYFDLLYKKTQELAKAQAQVRLHAKLHAEAYEQELATKREFGEESEQAIAAKKALDEIQKNLDEATELENRTRMTNLDSAQNVRVHDQAVRFLITKIKERIPNAEVIGLNGAFVQFGAQTEIVKFSCAGSSPGSAYYKEMGNIGTTQRKGELPDLTVVMNPAALYYREGARENYLGKMYGTVRFVEAPILVDARAITEKVGGYKINVPSVRAAMDSMFAGGMLMLTIDQKDGVDIVPLTADVVRTLGQTRAPKKVTKYHWIGVPTDWHVGGMHRVRIPRHNGMPTYVTEAFFELLQRSGMDEDGATHIGGLIVMDDILHGNHFGTHLEDHRQQEPSALVMAEVSRELDRLLPLTRAKVLHDDYRAIIQHMATQIALRTPHNIHGQFRELITGILDPYKDVFRGILLRAKKSGVIMRGVGELTTGRPDRADAGIIIFDSGNHATKSVNYMDREGPHAAALVQQRLKDDPLIRAAGIDVDRWITAPTFGQNSIAYGRMSIGGGPEWGIHISSTPPKRDSWHDTIHGWVQANRQVGNPSAVLHGVPVLHFAGDKHIPSVCNAAGDFYILGSANTHTESFAYMAGGLPENPPGVWLVGVPADGPDSGPVRTVYLTVALLREYLADPTREFPWQEFCPSHF